MKRSMIITAVAAALAVLTYFALPAGVNELARRAAAIFVVAAVFWATEALPLYATSLLVLGFEILFLAEVGGLARLIPATSDFPVAADGSAVALSSELFYEPFSSSIVILFMGGFLLSAAVSKHGLDRVIAARLLRPVAGSPFAMLAAVLGITAFFSMWMSNTATTAMMLAIVAPLLAQVPRESRFATGLILAVPFGANVGGIGTPIGSPPNAVALASLRLAGLDMGFVDWMFMAVPLMVIGLVLTMAVLYLAYRPEPGLSVEPMDKPGPMSRPAKIALAVLLSAIALWLTGKFHGLGSSAVALLAAAALAAFGVLKREDVDSIDWNILILMWGGLSLGQAMEGTGLTGYLVELPIAQLQGLALAAVVCVLAVVVSTFMSNTAAANLIVPMAVAIAPAEGAQLAILAGLAPSFAMSMPVSTPPNAMAFATGRIPVIALVKYGTILAVLGVGVMLAGYRVVLPWALRGL